MEQLKIVLTQQCYECFWLRMSEHKMINNIEKLTKNDLYHYAWETYFEKNTPFYGKLYCNTQIIVQVFKQWVRLKFNKEKSKVFKLLMFYFKVVYRNIWYLLITNSLNWKKYNADTCWPREISWWSGIQQRKSHYLLILYSTLRHQTISPQFKPSLYYLFIKEGEI